jgi:hypothetical protein
MQLWTYQRPDFSVDNLPLPLDPMRGRYWETVAHYWELAPMLWKRLNDDNQFPWCYTLPLPADRRGLDTAALVEWEIFARPAVIVRCTLTPTYGRT